MEDIIISGGEYEEHEHTKVARMGLKDPQAGICLLITVIEVASLICTFYHPIKCIVTYLFKIVFKSKCILVCLSIKSVSHLNIYFVIVFISIHNLS